MPKMLDHNPHNSGTESDGARAPLNASNLANAPAGTAPARIAENNSKNINTGFVLAHTAVIAMGFLQFGK